MSYQLYNKYFNTYKQNYGSEKVKDEEKIIHNGDQEPKSTKKRRDRDKKT